MNEAPSAGFAQPYVDHWREWQSQPWGRLLYSTSHLNLSRHLPDRPRRVLDVGGGNGTDSLHFATQGHTVTLLDASNAMLAEAQARAEAGGLRARLTLCQADADELHGRFPAQSFDVILCHMMIEFVSDPMRLLEEVSRLLAPRGLLSVVDTNCYSECYRLAFQTNDLARAGEAVGQKRYLHPWVNREVPRFSAADIIEQLPRLGCQLLGQYGVLNLCSYLPNEPKYDPQYFAELERLEHRLTDVYPYHLLARLFQVIAQKQEGAIE